jgi:hypothetical protein
MICTQGKSLGHPRFNVSMRKALLARKNDSTVAAVSLTSVSLISSLSWPSSRIKPTRVALSLLNDYFTRAQSDSMLLNRQEYTGCTKF